MRRGRRLDADMMHEPATDMAVALAEQLGITVVGHVRPDLYTGEAVVVDEAG